MADDVPSAHDKMKTVSIRVPRELDEKVHDAVYWTRSTLVEFCAEALRRELARQEKVRGEPFAPRETPALRRGRRAR